MTDKRDQYEGTELEKGGQETIDKAGEFGNDVIDQVTNSQDKTEDSKESESGKQEDAA